jgi:hypothetical protein
LTEEVPPRINADERRSGRKNIGFKHCSLSSSDLRSSALICG